MRPGPAPSSFLLTVHRKRSTGWERPVGLPTATVPAGTSTNTRLSHSTSSSPDRIRTPQSSSAPTMLSAGANSSEPTVVPLGVVSLSLGGRFDPGSSGTPPSLPPEGVVVSVSSLTVVAGPSSDSSLPHDVASTATAIAIAAIRRRFGRMRWMWSARRGESVLVTCGLCSSCSWCSWCSSFAWWTCAAAVAVRGGRQPSSLPREHRRAPTTRHDPGSL